MIEVRRGEGKAVSLTGSSETTRLNPLTLIR